MPEQERIQALQGDEKTRATEVASSENAPGEPGPASQKQPHLESSPRILLVEDDPSLAHLEAEVLIAHGYMVAITGNGERAIAALRQTPPDLVVLDLQLQGEVSGWDVLHDLRRYAKTPVLLTSSETTIRAQIRTSGEPRSTLDHLPKPYHMQAFVKRIKRMLLIAPR